jgi:hypothetical protein
MAWRTGIAALMALSVAVPLMAQQALIPGRLGLASGRVVVGNDDGRAFADGFHLDASINLPVARSRAVARVEFGWSRMRSKEEGSNPSATDTVVFGQHSVLSADVGILYPLRATDASTRPFLSGRAGFFRRRQDGAIYSSQDLNNARDNRNVSTDVGVSGGVGLMLGRTPGVLVVEVRAVRVLGNAPVRQFYPVTLGIIF